MKNNNQLPETAFKGDVAPLDANDLDWLSGMSALLSDIAAADLGDEETAGGKTV